MKNPDDDCYLIGYSSIRQSACREKFIPWTLEHTYSLASDYLEIPEKAVLAVVCAK